MFDAAVLSFGRHIENKLREVDENGQPVWELRQLLDLPLSPYELRQETLNSLKMLELEARRPHSGIVSDV